MKWKSRRYVSGWRRRVAWRPHYCHECQSDVWLGWYYSRGAMFVCPECLAVWLLKEANTKAEDDVVAFWKQGVQQTGLPVHPFIPPRCGTSGSGGIITGGKRVP